MDEIKASPEKYPWLGDIVRGLRKGATTLTNANPMLGYLGRQLLGDAPEEMERWSYGDSPLQNKANSPAFKEDRFLPAIEATTLAPVGAAIKGVGTGVTEAGLYANALRKDLLASHNTKLSSLLTRNPKTGVDALPLELYHPSFGVTKDKAINFDDGDTWLIPKYGKLDPAKDSASLFAYDGFTPRYHNAAGLRADTILNVKNHQTDPVTGLYDPARAEAYLREEANMRLADRFARSSARSGLKAEGTKSTVQGLPRYGSGGYGLGGAEIYQPSYNINDMSNVRRFQSLKDYEKSPYGAARLEGGPDAGGVGFKIEELLLEPEVLRQQPVSWLKKHHEATGALDANVYPKGFIPENLKLEALLNILRGKQHSPEMVSKARGLVDQLRKTKAEYGELKGWGAFPLHRDNLAGIVTEIPRNSMAAERYERLYDSAKQRGIPVHAMNLDYGASENLRNVFDKAKEMQDEAQGANRSFSSMLRREPSKTAGSVSDLEMQQVLDDIVAAKTAKLLPKVWSKEAQAASDAAKFKIAAPAGSNKTVDQQIEALGLDPNDMDVQWLLEAGFDPGQPNFLKMLQSFKAENE